MKRVAIGFLALVILGLGAVALYLSYMSRSGADPAFFEPEVQAFLEADRANPPAPGQIVFFGSSSIRFWSTLACPRRSIKASRRRSLAKADPSRP